MKILGHKPSEIRKTILTTCAVLTVLLMAVPVGVLPVSVAAPLGAVTALVAGVTTYLTRNDVAEVIDATDNLGG